MTYNPVVISPSGADWLNVVQITDPHISPLQDTIKGMDTAASLECIINAINLEPDRPDIILATGDLVHEPSANAYSKIKDLLQKFTCPVFCLPGNHDNYTMMQNTLNEGRVSTSKVIVAGNWKFVLLDSVVTGREEGYLEESELSFLQEQLNSKDEKFLVICLHHHPVIIDSPWMDKMVVANGSEFLDMVKTNQLVKCILWGHIHQEFTSYLEHILLLGSPSTCIQFKPNTSKFIKDILPPGFRKFKFFSDGHISSTLHWLDTSVEHDTVRW